MFANIHFDYYKNIIHLWEYQNGERVYLKEDYIPYCYVPAKTGDFVDLNGVKCRKKIFRNWSEQREFLQRADTYEGDVSPEDRFLIDRYHNVKDVTTLPDLHIHVVDLEYKFDDGFSSADEVKNEITIITVYSSKTKKLHSFGLFPYEHNRDDLEYTHCEDEKTLLREYFKWHKTDFPDVISGWNSTKFDVKYILNRAKFIIGEHFINRYSPIGTVNYYNGDYTIAGISLLDFMDLYKTFVPNERESYSLNYISSVELGEEKVKFDGSLKDLWKTNWRLYCEYNFKDVTLVVSMEDKLALLKLVQAQSYACKVPFERYGSAIRKFDNYLMSVLKSRNIVVPTLKRQHASEIPGGYVSEPKVGYYKSIVSYDFTSLYPHIIMAMNISPETFKAKLDGSFTELNIDKIKDEDNFSIKGKNFDGAKLKSLIKEKELILAPNGVLYSSKPGFVPSIVKDLYAQRKKFKENMLVAKKKYQETKDEKYKKEAAAHDSFQKNYKVLLNSMYGILANANFRFFNPDAASAITLTGQYLIKYADIELNKFFKDKFGIEKDVTIYSDTDSCYVDFSKILEKMKIKDTDKFIEFVDKLNSKVLDNHLNKKFEEFSARHNIKKNYFDLKREAISVGAIFIQKKKYALYIINDEGLTFPKPKLVVKGIEIVRSSTPGFCRERIKDIVNFIFEEFDKEKTIEKLRKIKKEFKTKDISEISFPRGLKHLEKYIINGIVQPRTPIGVRASNNFNFIRRKYNLEKIYDEIRNGDKIKFIYLNPDNPIKENIIAFKEGFPEESGMSKYIDYDLQFEKSFMAPIQNICSAIGWEFDLNMKDISDFF